MALTGKMVSEVEINSTNSDDIFHIVAGTKAQHAPNLSPEKVHKVEIHQGDWGDHGSIKVWTYVTEGQVETYKEKVSIDEETKTVHMTALEGHCLELYKSYNIIFEFIHKGETNAVKITIEYEKKNEHVPPPQKYMDFLISLIKDLDANLVKE
ncbi:MLP-like protein 328 [Rhododendron vialii]|uniref:MLP-like protein 328 n=1 Tax=Rhododendron vialii TaxID=182163 RepID=UPI00265E016A|nr:MLP-like protein 328 [Rhododendron vialii]